MHCLRCKSDYSDDSPSCPCCGLNLGELDHKFGVVPRHNQEITDGAGLYTRRAKLRIVRQLRLLHGRFPEVELSIFSCVSPNRPTREYGYWVFNRCRFHQVRLRFERCHSLLLLFNLADASASLTAGYGLEGLLSEADIARVLETGVADWAEQRYEAGTLRMIEELTDQLRKSVQKISTELAEAAEPVVSSI